MKSQPRSIEILLTTTAVALVFAWVLNAIDSLGSLYSSHNWGPLLVSGLATIGYLEVMRLILRRSRLSTYLWARYVQRKPVSRV